MKLSYEMKDCEWHPAKEKEGLKSFKFKLSNSQKLCGDVLTDALSMLHDVNGKRGMFVASECPTFLKDWVKLSVDRIGPIRQYFGHTKVEKKRKVTNDGYSTSNAVQRASYGVTARTTSGDMKTTITRDMTPAMQALAEALSEAHRKNWKNGCTSKKNVHFNHVTVLFYLTNPIAGEMNTAGKRTAVLNYHTDCSRSASNKRNKNAHEQVHNTPTIVLSLGDTKEMSFAKRYSDGAKFMTRTKAIAKKQLEHGSFHYLHPEDEHVVKRRVRNANESHTYVEEEASQFQHAIKCTSGKRSKNVKVSVSFCFREVPYCSYDRKTNTLLDENGEFVKNDCRTDAMNKRDKLLRSKAKEMKTKPGRSIVQKYLQPYYDRLVGFKKSNK